MAEILFTNRALTRNDVMTQCGINDSPLFSLTNSTPNQILPNVPHVLGEKSPVNTSILSSLSQQPVAKTLNQVTSHFGEESAVALAEVTNQLTSLTPGMIGTTTSLYTDRVSGFVKAVQKYQSALEYYHEVSKSKSPMASAAKRQVHKLFQEIQVKFRSELASVVARNRAKNKSKLALNNSTRGVNLAKSNRNINKLNVTSQVQADNLVKMTKYAKVLGNGLAMIDFTSRGAGIYNTYKAGGNWTKEMAVQGAGFAVGGLTGIAMVKGALYLVPLITPFGLIALVATGVAVVAATAYTSSLADKTAQNLMSQAYKY
ncbi:conserved hypothetical protein [Vibrio nigripulchritudo SO65]|nr:hypothetical protein [Vibrio nigripulchritudo]CCN35956.1 conserved hypothetical protein [Vibrio nigripulchritudo AM115]CCN42825.1 conserved hypothetical protein [Vibrio nigripulchritudo FTn2]CCN65819.1 conserved hypothetical protein [Vibrio nigripulchritudo POn4]CCN76966.1 conserved hypothetical protein [Vibrio nigripulchritudo SO65]